MNAKLDSLPRPLRLCSLLGLLLLWSACNGTTLLQANFNSDAVGSPPAPAQGTGTVSVDKGAGTVIVVAKPAAGLPDYRWARINHPAAPSPETTMTGHFSQFGGNGHYNLLASLFLPSGAGVATVQFEAFGSSADFLHLDFMPEGNVRVDDVESSRFGQFPRDQAFVVSVNLDITAAAATAHVALLGAGASGSTDVAVKPALLPVAHQFGAVKFWMGFQHKGSFFVDDILVKRKNP